MTPLRILLVCEDLPAREPGGLGKHVVVLGNALIAEGHSVTLMGRGAAGTSPDDMGIGFNGPIVGGCGNPSVGWKEGPMGVFVPGKRPYLARRIAASIRLLSSRFDVVHYHGHLPMLGRYVGPSLNFVQTRHDQGSDCITHMRFRNGDVCVASEPKSCASCAHPSPGPIRSAISAAAVRRYRKEVADAFSAHPVIFVSEFLRSNLRRRNPDMDLSRSTVIHNFIEERLLHAAGGVDTEADHVIHIAGRIDEAKGIVRFLGLARGRLNAPWTFRVFGDGPNRDDLQALCQSDRIEWRGFRSSIDVYESLWRSRAVVVPSMWEEAFGAVVVEALRAGKPCYALARGGVPELDRYGAPGQLRLFPDLQSLLEQLLIDLPRLAPASGGASADVSTALSAVLEVYRRRLTGQDLAA
jgi:glycosyltransferase involved in cell wall biosynthesis